MLKLMALVACELSVLVYYHRGLICEMVLTLL